MLPKIKSFLLEEHYQIIPFTLWAYWGVLSNPTGSCASSVSLMMKNDIQWMCVFSVYVCVCSCVCVCVCGLVCVCVCSVVWLCLCILYARLYVQIILYAYVCTFYLFIYV